MVMEKFFLQIIDSKLISGEALFFLILLAVGIGLGFLIGRYRLVALLASVYFSSAIFSVIPKEYVPTDPIYVLLVFTFLVLIFTFLDEYLFDVNADIARSLWSSVIIGFFAVGVFISAVFALIPWSAISNIVSKQIYIYLAGPWARFLWMVLPLIFFFIIKKKKWK